MALTDIKIRQAKPGATAIKLTDSAGLFLEIRPNGSKLWRYRFRIAGKENTGCRARSVVALRPTDGERITAMAGDVKLFSRNKKTSIEGVQVRIAVIAGYREPMVSGLFI